MVPRDSETRLPSAELFADRLEQAIAMAKRKRSRVALVHLDLAGAGKLTQEVVATLAERLITTVRTTDTVVCLPGHDFTVLLNDVDGRLAARAVAEELLLAIRKPMTTADEGIRVDADYTLTLYPDDAADAAELLSATPAA